MKTILSTVKVLRKSKTSQGWLYAPIFSFADSTTNYFAIIKHQIKLSSQLYYLSVMAEIKKITTLLVVGESKIKIYPRGRGIDFRKLLEL